jgi:zinc finger protein
MEKRDFSLPVEHCPICGATGTFQVVGRVDNIPYFGETIETLVCCSNCKFKHADVMHLGEGEAARLELKISSAGDMNVRVVKSSTGVIEFPELGVVVRPGPSSDGYVTNVEGILNRVKEAITSAKSCASPAKQRVAQRKLAALERIRRGGKKATLILTDPLGHSTIIDKRAKRRKLTKSEISKLTAST